MAKSIETTVGKTWDDVTCWQDILDAGTKEIIQEVLSDRARKFCPYLKKINEDGQAQFAYCEVRCKLQKSLGFKEGSPDFNEARYQSCIDSAFLQLFCADGEERYKKCVDFLKEKGGK